jgi:hypothetical protein
LILAKKDVLTVSRALELALFMDAKLEVGGTRSSGPRSAANDERTTSSLTRASIYRAFFVSRFAECLGAVTPTASTQESQRKKK